MPDTKHPDSPAARLWEAIYRLQVRVDALEAERWPTPPAPPPHDGDNIVPFKPAS